MTSMKKQNSTKVYDTRTGFVIANLKGWSVREVQIGLQEYPSRNYKGEIQMRDPTSNIFKVNQN